MGDPLRPFRGRIAAISLEFHDLRRAGATGPDLARRLGRAGHSIARLRHGPTRIDNGYGHLVAVRAALT